MGSEGVTFLLSSVECSVGHYSHCIFAMEGALLAAILLAIYSCGLTFVVLGYFGYRWIRQKKQKVKYFLLSYPHINGQLIMLHHISLIVTEKKC